MEKKKKGTSTGLEQILLNVVIIEAFSIVENWLLFYYQESQVLPIIFGVLTAMMCCLLTINIYNCFIGGLRKGSGVQDSLQAQAVLYKQIKKLQTEVPENVQKELDALEANVFKTFEEVKKNQLRSAKAVMAKVEEQQGSGEPSAESATVQDIEKITQILAQIQQTQAELRGMLEAVPARISAESEDTIEETAVAEESEAILEKPEAESLTEEPNRVEDRMADDYEEDVMPSEDELMKAFAEKELDLSEENEELLI